MKNGNQSLRHGDWKLIAPKEKAPLLFNISADPFEKNDLASTHPEMVAKLQKLRKEQHAKDQPQLPADLVGLPH
jgi:arylsulfatase A-like enzyme